MDWNEIAIQLESRKARRKKKKRYSLPGFPGHMGFAYGPAFPCGTGFEMSSVPGGADGCGDAGCACESVNGDDIDDEEDDLMMSDNDKLIYALRGIIENAKVAYEAVTGIPYDEDGEVDDAPKDEEG